MSQWACPQAHVLYIHLDASPISCRSEPPAACCQSQLVLLFLQTVGAHVEFTTTCLLKSKNGAEASAGAPIAFDLLTYTTEWLWKSTGKRKQVSSANPTYDAPFPTQRASFVNQAG
jgi:hypothetical protein